MMKYLITGGAGFIGSHLADALIAEGHQVVAIDNLSTGSLDNIEHLLGHPRFAFSEADILDVDALRRHVADCDEIFHLAAAVGVKRIMEQPVETIITNVRGTENILELADRYARKVLIASTSEVYGKLMETDDDTDLLREDGDWRLGATSKRRWAYACSKAMDEFLSLAYFAEKGLPVVVVRFFNTVGPRQTGRYGMVIPSFVQSALAGEPIQVHGDGEQTRSFTYVEDAVHAMIRLMETEAAAGTVVNVGNDEEISISELARLIKEMTGSSSPIIHTPYEQVFGDGFEDMRRRTPDLTKIRRLIQYEPRYSVREILQHTIAHTKAAKPSPWPASVVNE